MRRLKSPAARLLVRWLLPRLLREPHTADWILGRAAQLQLGRIGDDAFRADLEAFYTRMSPEACSRLVELDPRIERLAQPGGYKSNVSRFAGDPIRPSRLDIWGRRVALLQHLNIKLDVLKLNGLDQIPPHGHSRVVSGFYVLAGEVAVRHFDRVEDRGGAVLLRKALDVTMGPGGHTTNSERYHNVHWLQAVSPTAYLFRVSVTGVPVTPFGPESSAVRTRVYVDPTGAPGPGGLILAPYVDEAEAKALGFRP